MINIRKNVNFCVGVRKSATSWMWRQLAGHPEVGVVTFKECYYYNDNYHMGLNWYLSQFNNLNKKVLFDGTPDYFICKKCPSLIKKDFPNSKIILILRNPVHRAFSQWKFAKFTDSLSVEDENESFFSLWKKDWRNIRTAGLYHIYLNNYLEFFQLDNNFKIIFYEEIKKQPEKIVKDVYDYLEIDNRYRYKKFNEHFMPPGSAKFWKNKTGSSEKSIKSYVEYNSKFDSELSICCNEILSYYLESINIIEKNFSFDLSSWNSI